MDYKSLKVSYVGSAQSKRTEEGKEFHFGEVTFRPLSRENDEIMCVFYAETATALLGSLDSLAQAMAAGRDVDATILHRRYSYIGKENGERKYASENRLLNFSIN